MKPLVYVGMSGDFIHNGHINIINIAKSYGSVIIGLLTDEAIASYKRVPILSYEQRKTVISSINGVSKVVPQNTLDYTENLKKYKPNYVVHGNDWKKGIQSEVRKKVVDTLKQWNGKLVEPAYTEGISSTLLIEDKIESGVTPQERRSKLKLLLKLKPIVRVIESYNGLSALVAEKTKIRVGATLREFDAIWESSLTDSTSKGKPDIELVDFTSRVNTINEILEVTTKPIIVDGDTGGFTEHFVYMVKTLERLGVSAVIIEDKTFPKRNSLLEGAVHIQENVDDFCNKIKAGIQARVTDDFMIIARIESLIARHDLPDALIRAKKYIEAGADAIMIHSKEKTPKEIKDFCVEYKKFEQRVPLVVVPTTYNSITEDELEALGVNIVIYANHLLRSSYKAMKEVAETILKNERSLETDSLCYPVRDLLKIISIWRIYGSKKEIRERSKGSR